MSEIILPKQIKSFWLDNGKDDSGIKIKTLLWDSDFEAFLGHYEVLSSEDTAFHDDEFCKRFTRSKGFQDCLYRTIWNNQLIKYITRDELISCNQLGYIKDVELYD